MQRHLPVEPLPARRSRHTLPRTKRRAVTGAVNILYLLFWVSLAAIAYFGMNALTAPKVASVAALNHGAREIVIPRSRNGHYFVEGAINGQAVMFMVDTGASTVAIDVPTARNARLPKGYPTTFTTASGEAPGETVPHQRVTVGGLQFDDATVAVIEGAGEISLLGQNILRHLDVTQSGDQMILREKIR